jgi:hypothetical protein
MQKKEKLITTIPQVIDLLEEIIDTYTTLDERRPLVQLIKFCHRMEEEGKKLEDIIYWIMKGVPHDYEDTILHTQI